MVLKMKSAFEFREHASECRAIAKQTSGGMRRDALTMAELLERLARTIERTARRRKLREKVSAGVRDKSLDGQ